MRFLLGWILAVVTGVAAPAAAGPRYTIASGDVLRIEVLQDSSLDRNVLVLPDGTIDFPYIGSIRAAGQTPDALRGRLAAALAPSFATTPSVSVAVRSLGKRDGGGPARITVYAMGEIGRSGALDVKPGTTLLQLLALAGGFTEFAARRRVELHRIDPASGVQRTRRFDLLAAGGSAGAMRLEPGDVIVVPQLRLFELD